MAFLRKFEYDTDTYYTGIDMGKACDHYISTSHNFYLALKHRFAKINIQISKLLYYSVFTCTCLYFVYVYIHQIFVIDVRKVEGGSNIDEFLKLLFSTTSKSTTAEAAAADLNHKNELFVSFLLISLLVAERQIILAVSQNILDKEETSCENTDINICANNLLAHLELYISVREAVDPSNKNKPTLDQIEELKDRLSEKLSKVSGNPKLSEAMEIQKTKREATEEVLDRIRLCEPEEKGAEDTKLKICLHETTHYNTKILFFNLIRRQFSSAQLHFAMMHHIHRIGIIFLMTIATISPSALNVLLLAIVLIFELRNKSFVSEIGWLCILSSIFIMKDDILIMLHKLSYMNAQLKHYQWIFYHDIKVVYFATSFLLIGNFLMLVSIGLTKSILIRTNSYKIQKSKIFWSYNIKTATSKKGHKTILFVDHKKWIIAGNSFLITLKNLLYIYPLEIYLISIISVGMMLREQIALLILIPPAALYFLSLLIKDQVKKARWQRIYFQSLIVIWWVSLLLYYPLSVNYYSYTVGQDFLWSSHLMVNFSLPLAILINKTYYEFMTTEDYTESQDKLEKQKVLLSSLINYCHTYDYNEQKLRENINIIFKQNHVMECTEKISTVGDNDNLGADSYPVNDIFSHDDDILNIVYQKCSTWQRLKVKAYSMAYKVLLACNYEGLFESVFYLYRTFRIKNAVVVGNQREPNLNQFLKLESDMMLEAIKQAEQYYQRLREVDSEYLKDYKIKLKELNKAIDKEEYEAKQQESEGQMQENELEPNNLTTTLPVTSKKKQSDLVHAIEEFIQDDEAHRQYDSNLLFDELTKDKYQKKNETDTFTFNMMRGREYLVFENIQPYFIEQTNYFTRFDYMVFMKLILGMILSNMELIIILFMTVIHIWAGGMYPIVTFTIVFFILIEERAGRYKLWLIILAIYILVLMSILFISNKHKYVPINSEVRLRQQLPPEHVTQWVLLLIGKVESVYGICVNIFLIILLRINLEKLGFYNKDIMSVETLPMAAYRIVINNYFYDIFNKHIEMQKHQVEAIEKVLLQDHLNSSRLL